MQRFGLTVGEIGSSPRGRGTPMVPPLSASMMRFIPARAGNTRTCRATAARSTVHPRAGGEHRLGATGELVKAGSSPRGRGTQLFVSVGCQARRFIPARAGNTLSPRWTKRRATVHPRAGGEHTNGTFPAGVGYGSSPRGRGTHGVALDDPSLERFIPARAGNTAASRSRPDRSSVHPRAGGEHMMSAASMVVLAGSSPRGRGTHRIAKPGYVHVRFIPARAGNTPANPHPPA